MVPVRRAVSAWLAATMILAAACGLFSCAGPPVQPCRYPDEFLYSEVVDSIGLEAFESLPQSERLLRQRLAETWRQRAQRAPRTSERWRALRNIVGLSPDSAEDWLKLAELGQILGDHNQAIDNLLSAVAAVKYAPQDRRNALRLRIALLQAWIRYDRGEWRNGVTWTEVAQELGAGDRRTLLIKGLILGGAERSLDATWVAQEIERQDYFRTDWRWIRGMAAFYQDLLPEAVFYLEDLRPNPFYRSECWTDQGYLYERIQNWHFARRSFRRAYESLDLPDKSCLVDYARRVPGAEPKAPKLPIWLAFDRFYVTGSLFAYAELALERFEAAASGPERDYWADSVIRTTSICLRKHIGEPWAQSWRGRALAQLELDQQAESDLGRALQEFARRGEQDPSTLFWLGHVKLRREEYPAALTLLQQAVAADSTRAQAWSDLGLAMIMTKDLEAGRRALDRALSLDPLLAVAWYNRGLMYFNAQSWEDSVRDLREAARLAPDNPDIAALLERAALLAEHQRWQDPPEP